MVRNIIALFFLSPVVVFASISASLQDGISGLTSNSVIDIAHDSSSVWAGTGGGAAVTADSGSTWTTYGEGHGLPRDEISALVANNRGVWVANSHSEDVSGDRIPYGDGISFSSDGGETWETFTPRQVTWPGMLSYDAAVYDSMVFSACFYGGLIRSIDFGQTWVNLFPSQLDEINSDSVDFHNNIFNSLNNRFFSVQVDTTALPDTFSIWAGSAAGINHFIFNSWNFYGWHRYDAWDSSGARVSGESPEEQNDDWLISPSVDFTAATACTLFFRQYYDDLVPGLADYATVLLSDDSGATWPETLVVFADSALGNDVIADSQWLDISAFAAGKSSIMAAFSYSKDIGVAAGSWLLDDVTFSADDSVYLLENFEGIWGSLGDVPPQGWNIIDNERTGAFNLLPDSVRHITRADTTVEDSLLLPGDFVVALGVQDTGPETIIWAACRPAFGGYLRVAYSRDAGEAWHEAPVGGLANSVEAWDFAFSGDTVYVATSEGLFRSSDDYSIWSMITDFVDTEDQTFYQYDAPFFTVDIADGVVWAGGSDGIGKSIETGGWDVFRSALDPDDHYAYPSPFSPYHSARHGTTIHFRPSITTNATINVYDTNLEHVKTVVSGIPRVGGIESDDIVWDGTNDDGDLVANGVYFYRIELDSGEDLWGKVMIIK
jgi:hypothetical protein